MQSKFRISRRSQIRGIKIQLHSLYLQIQTSTREKKKVAPLRWAKEPRLDSQNETPPISPESGSLSVIFATRTTFQLCKLKEIGGRIRRRGNLEMRELERGRCSESYTATTSVRGFGPVCHWRSVATVIVVWRLIDCYIIL